MDSIIRKAVAFGVDPITAVKMCTINTAEYFKLSERGAVAPGYYADLVVIDEFDSFNVEKVFIDGRLVAEGEGYKRQHLSLPETIRYFTPSI